jgi:phenylalanyl-tRNA synthetase beta chain
MLRDIAVWVPADVPAEEVLAVIIACAPALLTRHDLFDTYENNGRVSHAWHLVFESFERTLTDEDVNPIMLAVTEALVARGWEVR